MSRAPDFKTSWSVSCWVMGSREVAGDGQEGSGFSPGGSALPALKVCMWAVSPRAGLSSAPLPDFPSVPPLYTVLLGNLTPIEALFDVSS